MHTALVDRSESSEVAFEQLIHLLFIPIARGNRPNALKWAVQLVIDETMQCQQPAFHPCLVSRLTELLRYVFIKPNDERCVDFLNILIASIATVVYMPPNTDDREKIQIRRRAQIVFLYHALHAGASTLHAWKFLKNVTILASDNISFVGFVHTCRLIGLDGDCRALLLDKPSQEILEWSVEHCNLRNLGQGCDGGWLYEAMFVMGTPSNTTWTGPNIICGQIGTTHWGPSAFVVSHAVLDHQECDPRTIASLAIVNHVNNHMLASRSGIFVWDRQPHRWRNAVKMAVQLYIQYADESELWRSGNIVRTMSPLISYSPLDSQEFIVSCAKRVLPDSSRCRAVLNNILYRTMDSLAFSAATTGDYCAMSTITGDNSTTSMVDLSYADMRVDVGSPSINYESILRCAQRHKHHWICSLLTDLVDSGRTSSLEVL
jgi:hypothetical protein